MTLERVQKIMSNAGICSRRKAEELIAEGKVIVNSSKIKLGDKADPAKDLILISGKPLIMEQRKYYAFYKPKNVLSTLHDPFGKSTIADFTANLPVRVFPVGRLDYDAEGLILLTNDGDFANKIMHPRYETSKTYEVELRDRLRDEQFKKLRGTIRLDDGTVKIEDCKKIGENFIEITIHEGRHKIVKRIFKELGFYVKRLKRIKVGPIKIGRMKPGMIDEIPLSIITGIMSGKTPLSLQSKQISKPKLTKTFKNGETGTQPRPRASSFSKDKEKKAKK